MVSLNFKVTEECYAVVYFVLIEIMGGVPTTYFSLVAYC